jgi:hypothetical protein
MFCFPAAGADGTTMPVDMMDKQTTAINTLEMVNKMKGRRMINNGDDDLVMIVESEELLGLGIGVRNNYEDKVQSSKCVSRIMPVW